MEFKNKQSPKISDSKAYRQWETIMYNSGWFENEQQNSGEFEREKVSNLDGASFIAKIEKSDKSNLRGLTLENEVNTEIRECKAYRQWETIMYNSGWFENEQQNSGFEMDNVSKVDGACVFDKLEKIDKSKLPELPSKSFEINTEKRSCTHCR